MRRSSITLLHTLLFIFATCAMISRVASSSNTNTPIPSHQPDRWVSASPLAISAVCKDGFAFVATHTTMTQEPLLLPLNEVRDEVDLESNQEGGENSSNEQDHSDSSFHMRYAALPSSFRGPFRIERLDGEGTCLVSAGWRADCSSLAEKCRSLAASELSLYGKDGLNARERGRVLAEGAALWMAQCDFSNNVRALSCVGLLASSSNNDSGNLWLIDSTGAYPVRALAIGSGASFINKRLCNIAFHNVSKEEGVKLLLKLLEEEYSHDENENMRGESDEEQENVGRIVPDGSYVELAVTGFGSRSMKRVQNPFL